MGTTSFSGDVPVKVVVNPYGRVDETQITITPKESPAALPDLTVAQVMLEEVSRAKVRVENIGDAGAFVVDLNGAQQTVADGLAAGAATTVEFASSRE